VIPGVVGSSPISRPRSKAPEGAFSHVLVDTASVEFLCTGNLVQFGGIECSSVRVGPWFERVPGPGYRRSAPRNSIPSRTAAYLTAHPAEDLSGTGANGEAGTGLPVSPAWVREGVADLAERRPHLRSLWIAGGAPTEDQGCPGPCHGELSHKNFHTRNMATSPRMLSAMRDSSEAVLATSDTVVESWWLAEALCATSPDTWATREPTSRLI
jgi:hypothetical protein